MKKVKITVLKTTLDKELAAEYGAEGLGPCPMMKAGQVFLPIMPNRKVSAMRPGKRFTSMFLRWRTGQAAACFITGTGLESPA